MIYRTLSSLSVGEEKYRIAEVSDSVVVQSMKPTGMDFPDEWITMHSAMRSHHGLKSCIQFVGLLMLNKQQDSKDLWECQH